MTKILKLDRQYLADVCGYFLPLIMDMLEARIRLYLGTEYEVTARVSMSVMGDVEKMLMRKYLTETQKFKIKLSEAQAIIFMNMMQNFPVPSDQFWRDNLRNNIVAQLHQQLATFTEKNNHQFLR